MLILNGNVFIGGRFEKKDIRIENGKFAEFAEPGELCGLEQDALNATGKYVIPGLVDVHTHGRIGLDFSKITEEGLEQLLASYKTCGITSVLATTMTNEPSAVEESLRVIGTYIKKQEKSACDLRAKLLGIHMEGPFLGKEKKGAHEEKYLQLPVWEQFETWQKLSGGNIRLVTVDPCLTGAGEFIQKCVENGIKVSLGHTACNYETAVKAQKLGADHITHTFNAMNPLHHREPGVIGAAMDTGMTMELICDGIHVHPAMVRMLFAAHPDKVVLVSDSIPAAGMEDGEYQSGGLNVTLKDGKAVLADGTIAGSAVSLQDCLRNAIKFGVSVEQAVNSATYLAAKAVGMEEIVGSIGVGRNADFLLL
ncbi:MAG: N-acetylglucosamine-6-phosphate deacetylase [Bacteroides sp.]|nr:N-acetylglucosamine-6-phosphate deacetylase [Bacteroides sp.]